MKHTKTVHRVACDNPSCHKIICRDWNEWEVLQLALDAAGWLVMSYPMGDEYYCDEHWTVCDPCERATPTHQPCEEHP